MVWVIYGNISFTSDVEWLNMTWLFGLRHLGWPRYSSTLKKGNKTPPGFAWPQEHLQSLFTGSMGRGWNGWTFHCWSGLCDVDFCLRCSMWFFLLNIVLAFVLGRLNHMLKPPFSGLYLLQRVHQPSSPWNLNRHAMWYPLAWRKRYSDNQHGQSKPESNMQWLKHVETSCMVDNGWLIVDV